jgi:hypothetical protein
MRASRGMGCMSEKKLKKLKEGGKVKGYELSKIDEERKAESEQGSPFNSKSMVPMQGEKRWYSKRCVLQKGKSSI